MRRPLLFTLAALSFTGSLAFFASGRTAEPAAQEADRWVGEYLKYARYDTERRGQFGEAQQIRIAKGADGYYLSKPYAETKFTEVKNGVLSDGKGGLGKIYLGSAEFADGKRVQILRAEFCYEQFILFGRWKEPNKDPELKGK
jgi:hypothetical protein